MAVDWGAWEYGSGNGMRVGVEANVESISHGEDHCTFTVEYWTENQYSMGDTQTLNLGGSIGGSVTFTNNDGGSPVKRATKTYTYTYSSSSYGSSPGSRTFTATLSGAYNGITPSGSDSRAIPARPYAAPASTTSASITRVSDETNKISWVNHPTAGAPYNVNTRIERYIYSGPGYAGQDWNVIAYISPSSTSYSDSGAIPNRKWYYRVQARNEVGDAARDYTSNVLYTSPATPTACTRLDMGPNQRIIWTNNVRYDEYAIEVWHAANGVWDATPMITYAAGATEHVHSAPATGVKHKYRVRAKTTEGTLLYSSYSGETTETAGSTSAPNAPTNLAPTVGTVVDGLAPVVLSWVHNSTDSSIQRKYQVQHRLNGETTWNDSGEVTTSTRSHTIVPGTYSPGEEVEWQVRTWGADAVESPWSALGSFFTQDLAPVKYPVYLDVTSGKLEADSSPASVGGGGIEWGSWVSVSRTATFSAGSIRYRRSMDGALVNLEIASLAFAADRATSADTGNIIDATIATLPEDAWPEIVGSYVGFNVMFGGTYVLFCTVSANGALTAMTTSTTGGVSASTAGHGSVTYAAPSTGGGSLGLAPLRVQEEGTDVMPGVTILDFQGAAVTATSSGAGKAVVTIEAGTGSEGPPGPQGIQGSRWGSTNAWLVSGTLANQVVSFSDGAPPRVGDLVVTSNGFEPGAVYAITAVVDATHGDLAKLSPHQNIRGPAGTSPTLAVQDENATVVASATQLDFQGSYVTAAPGAAGEAIITIGPPPASYSSAILADAPLAYWRFGETAGVYADSSGNGRTLTDFGAGGNRGVTGLITGDTDKAFESNSLSFSKHAYRAVESWMTPAALTYELLCKPTTRASAREHYSIMSRGMETGTPFVLRFSQVSGNTYRAYVAWVSGGVSKIINGATTFDITTSPRIHLAVTLDGTTGRLYFNGTEDGNIASGAMQTAGAWLVYGVWDQANYTYPFQGTIDEGAIYGTALSASKIASHVAGLSVPGPDSYTFTQGTAAATWTINHPMSYRPNIIVVDSSGRQVEGDVVYTDADTITVNFSGAFAGAAYLS